MHKWIFLKNNFKIYIKFDTKTAPTYFYAASNAFPDDGVTAPKYVGAVLVSNLMEILNPFLRKSVCASVGE
jgi:hypothetical protein